MAGFLDLPARSPKPRQRGLTHVLDRGLSCAEVDGLMEVAGDSVDLVKLGWGTALVTGNLNLGNVAPGDVLSLETLRLGLRSDTMGAS